MMQIVVPSGHHTVVLRYWPTTFTVGIVLAGCAISGLIAVAAVGRVRRRARPADTELNP
jgi:uncharacterized membrane protein YfhO